MKLKNIILGLAAAVPRITAAQPSVMNSDAQGFLERGKAM